MTVKATVTNTGKVAGKQVVQVYVALPGGILGNPSKVLASFGKTETLAPGASQTLQLTFALSEVASYDDGGYTGHKSCYVLEKGAYGIEVGASVRDTKSVLSIQKGETEVVSQLHERMAVTAETAYKCMANRDGNLFYFYYVKDNEKNMIIIEPSEEMVEMIKRYLPVGVYQG